MKMICNKSSICKYKSLYKESHCYEHSKKSSCLSDCYIYKKICDIKSGGCVPVFIELVKKTIKGAEWTKY